MDMASKVEQFVQIYQQLDSDQLHLLDNIYHDDIQFKDPLHQVQGLTELHQYMAAMYRNVISCQFNITASFYQNDQAAIYWLMTLRHPKLKSGQPVEVRGHSHLSYQDDKIIIHQDYFDAGEMLYQNLPALSHCIEWIKRRLQA